MELRIDQELIKEYTKAHAKVAARPALSHGMRGGRCLIMPPSGLPIKLLQLLQLVVSYGPNTNSSRPIPIILIPRADDTFVPYNRVQEYVDAWITRNGYPMTAVVTNPYPAIYQLCYRKKTLATTI